MMFNLKRHQKSKLNLPKMFVFINQIVGLEGLTCGLEPSSRAAHGSSFTLHCMARQHFLKLPFFTFINRPKGGLI